MSRKSNRLKARLRIEQDRQQRWLNKYLETARSLESSKREASEAKLRVLNHELRLKELAPTPTPQDTTVGLSGATAFHSYRKL